MRRLVVLALACTAIAACSSEPAPPPAPSYSAENYSAAIADIARPEADRARDAARKPGELLAFAQIDRGEKVGDYIMGGGYMTRLLALAVGTEGKVYAFQPAEFIAFRADYAKEQDEAVKPYANPDGSPGHVLALRAPIAAPGFPEPLDTIVTVMNLHDLFIPQMPAGTADRAIKALFDALKPGGKLVVVDHSAAEGSGTSTTDALHRIDKQAAIDALTAAGFVLEEESSLYAMPEDARDTNVFDPAIRGKTDQFTLRFRKPE